MDAPAGKRAHPRPAVTVDLVVLTVLGDRLQVLLVRRAIAPFDGWWALPGGFLRVGPSAEDQGEDLIEAAHRELEEETGLPRRTCHLRQIGAYGAPGRDPRGRVITVAFAALVPPDRAEGVTAGSDAADARWWPIEELPPLAFDHAAILSDAVSACNDALEHSTVAFELVPPEFSVAELRVVHEAFARRPPDPKNFHRRFRRMIEDGLVVPADGTRPTRGRAARLYRFAPGRAETTAARPGSGSR